MELRDASLLATRRVQKSGMETGISALAAGSGYCRHVAPIPVYCEGAYAGKGAESLLASFALKCEQSTINLLLESAIGKIPWTILDEFSLVPRRLLTCEHSTPRGCISIERP